MSYRFVRCPHCKMPHDAAVRVCPNTGLSVSAEVRHRSREGHTADPRPLGNIAASPPPGVPTPTPRGATRSAGERAGTAKAPSRAKEIFGPTPTRDVQQQLLGSTVGGRYRILGILGEGGMGTVYDAEHVGLGRKVAVKVLNPSQATKRVAVKRFQQEARAASAIGHPNICEVYDLGSMEDGSPYLVMEKLVGQTLAARIAKEGGLPFDDAVDVVGQILSALAVAHEKGILHRDIKPENIFLARRAGHPSTTVKLLDFGVSKMMAEFQTGDDALDLTRTGMVMGTPYYMSPEQARGERNLDGRVDVYACGVVLYEAIAGQRPFLAPNYNALLLAIISSSPRSIRDLRPSTPPELAEIIRRAMKKNRDDRYPSAMHFLRELAPYAARQNVPATHGRRHDASADAVNSARARERTRERELADTRADRHVATEARVRPRLEREQRPPNIDTKGRRPSVVDNGDSIDIPIHIHPLADHDIPLGDDDATEIFHPGKRPASSPRRMPVGVDETIKLDNAVDVEIIDGSALPPRRR